MRSITQKNPPFLLALLIAVAYAGNYFKFSLFFGVDFLFGSIAVLLVLQLFGVRWGTVAGIVASSYTYFLWNHPYAAVVLIFEAVFVGLLFRRKKQNILLFDAIYWLIIGMPLVWVFYAGLMEVESAQALMIMLKQGVNGIFNALISSLLVSHLPFHKWLPHLKNKRATYFQQTLLNLFFAFVFLPTMMLMVLDASRTIENIEIRINGEIETSKQVLVDYLHEWYNRRINTIDELAKTAANSKLDLIPLEPNPQLEKIQENLKTIKQSVPAFSGIKVTNAAGIVIASYPTTDEKRKQTLGVNISKLPIFQQTKKSLKQSITNVYEDPVAVPHIGLSMPVIKDKQFRGMVYALLSLNEISKRLHSQVDERKLQVTLIDKNERIIGSTKPDQLPMQVFDRKTAGELYQRQGNTYQWLPPKGSLPPMVRWKQSLYLQEVALGDRIPWRLIIEAPAAPNINYLQNVYIADLTIILAIAVLALGSAMWMSRRLVSPISKLAEVTNNLPDKLEDRENITWVNSSITEIESLVSNFKLMAIALDRKFQEIQKNNETLEQKVQERTAKLAKANQKLRHEIRERKLAEKALRRNEEKLARIFETIPSGVTLITSNGQIASANAAAEKILRLSRSNINERTYNDPSWKITTADGKPFPESELPFVRVIQTGKPVYGVEHAIEHPDGTRTILYINAAPIHDEAGNIISAIAALTDVTERKKAEESLRASESLYRTLARNFPNGAVILFDRDLRYTIADGAGLLPVGLSREMLEGKTIWESFPPETCEVLETIYRGALAGEASITEMNYNDRTYQVYTVPVKNENGEIFAGMVMTQDITKLKKAEAEIRTLNAELEQRVGDRTAQLEAANQAKEELFVREKIARMQAEESEQRFRFLAEIIPQIVWTAIPEGELNYVNQRTLDYFSSPAEEILGWEWTKKLHPDDLPECGDRWKNSLETGEPYEIEFRLLRGNDKSYRWHLARALPLYDREGKIVNWFGTCTDIDDRKRAEEVLRQQAEALAQANRMKDEFLAVVSHELRTPLNSILGWAKLLRSRQFDEVTTARALETMERNAKSQAQLIDDILDISRIIRGKIRLNTIPVNLVSVIQAAIDSAMPATAAKNIQLESKLDRVGSISGDCDRLQQIVWNLIANAIKFTPEGGRIEIRLDAVTGIDGTRSYAQITVSDTGKGISPEFLPYVFDRFRQADSSITRSYGGLGLGLAIVRHLTELHGGTVSVESLGEGQGATFMVKLPLLNTPELPITSNDGGLALVSAYSLSGLHVLVVDDDNDTRDFLMLILEQSGAKVTGVASVQEAIATIKEFKPDVLVSDIGMPGEDGYSLIRKLRSSQFDGRTDLPAVALTAYARDEDRKQALNAGFQMHLTKPVDPEKLIAVVASLGRERG